MDILLLMVPLIIVMFTIIFVLLPRYGPHYTSRLTCPRCKRNFNYHWVPGGSFLALRYGNHRKLKCPYCQTVSMFDIAHTRVSQTKRR